MIFLLLVEWPEMLPYKLFLTYYVWRIVWLNWMACSEFPWRPFLEHQAWCWTTQRRGNVFYYVYKCFLSRFYVFYVFYFYLNSAACMMSATFCKNPSKKRSFASVRPHAGCRNSLPQAMRDDSLPCTVQTSKLPSITIYLMVIGTASILWGVEFVHLSGVRPSVCRSVCPNMGLQQQTRCCCGPSRQEISIDCCMAHSSAACGEWMRAVARCQRT